MFRIDCRVSVQLCRGGSSLCNLLMCPGQRRGLGTFTPGKPPARIESFALWIFCFFMVRLFLVPLLHPPFKLVGEYSLEHFPRLKIKSQESANNVVYSSFELLHCTAIGQSKSEPYFQAFALNKLPNSQSNASKTQRSAHCHQ